MSGDIRGALRDRAESMAAERARACADARAWEWRARWIDARERAACFHAERAAVASLRSARRARWVAPATADTLTRHADADAARAARAARRVAIAAELRATAERDRVAAERAHVRAVDRATALGVTFAVAPDWRAALAAREHAARRAREARAASAPTVATVLPGAERFASLAVAFREAREREAWERGADVREASARYVRAADALAAWERAAVRSAGRGADHADAVALRAAELDRALRAWERRAWERGA